MANTGVRTIGIRELKAQTSAVVREIQATGAEFIVTVRGRPVARIEPIVADPAPSPDGMGGLRGALSELPQLRWEDFAEAAHLWEPKPLDS